jgi:hypothetical protein
MKISTISGELTKREGSQGFDIMKLLHYQNMPIKAAHNPVREE